MTNSVKVDQVSSIKQLLAQAKNWVFADYQKLTVNQMNNLRSELKKAGGDLKVVKNKLLEKANSECQFSGPTAVLLIGGGPSIALKVLTDFAKKNNGLLAIKRGFVENRWLSPSEVQLLASLPTKIDLLAMLCGNLKSPITRFLRSIVGPQRNLVYVLGEITAKKRGDLHE